jgi:DNA-directed RNA polymerase beta subunit
MASSREAVELYEKALRRPKSASAVRTPTQGVDKPPSAAPAPQVESDPNDVPADIDTILAATEKLLAVNRGMAEPDERDSLEFRRVYTPDKLMAERIKLDAGKLKRMAMRRLAKMRNLNGIGPGYFDDYTEGLIVGNPLSSPPEEINPMHLVEQNSRITQLGAGGLPSDESITPEAQSLHPSTFGFLDSIAGPESSRIGVDTRLATGARIGDDGNIYQQFHNRRTGQKEWLTPGKLVGKTLALPD